MDCKLSIVIPAYNAEPYLSELLDKLAPQITDEVELMVIDDGSTPRVDTVYDFIHVIRRTSNHGLSHARNLGIQLAIGEYISFIDADDLVSDTYVKDILDRIPFDYLEMSWDSFGGYKCGCKLNSDNDSLTNCSVCTRVLVG